jgi:hypothetical protein
MLCNKDKLAEKNMGIDIDGYSCIVEREKSGDSAVSVLAGLCVRDDMAIGEIRR